MLYVALNRALQILPLKTAAIISKTGKPHRSIAIKRNMSTTNILKLLSSIEGARMIDFELILYFSNKLLEKTSFNRTKPNRIQHILLDEYQDTKEDSI